MNLDAREWLESDGLGGFASGTVSGVRTRRYHGLLVVATTPPTGRMMLVNGFDAWVETPGGRVYLSTQRYAPDVLHPDGTWRLDQFQADPWPAWRWRLTDDADITQEVFVARGTPRTVVRWQLTGKPTAAKLVVRPLISGRDYHALHQENPGINFEAQTSDAGLLTWHPYLGVPGIRSRSNGVYTPDPVWYRHFLYLEERNRGLDDTEDLASPGTYEFDLAAGEAVWIIESSTAPETTEAPAELALRLRQSESERRRVFPSRLHRNADHYIVRRGDGCTILAGYPWFTDWGRDTFVALRGICLATGRIATARRILLEWADSVSEGMLPNRFPDGGEAPEFNAVDASLWFVIAVHDLLRAADGTRSVTDAHRRRLLAAVDQILRGYTRGTRFGIHLDSDGLLAAGVPGQQLTWMDSKVGDDVVTPRIGKPVEVQALWLNALAFAGRDSAEWRRLFERGLALFQAKFWNAERSCLFDVVDVNHQPGQNDGSLRPNQIFAIGGLPVQLLAGARAHHVVDTVERALVTPFGLRSLAPGDQGYTSRYEGNASSRDHAYHQGTVWPWLTGAFVEAWLRVRDNSRQARVEARDRFVRPMLGGLDRLGLGHLPEITDAEAPFTLRGSPFQAWSMGELMRLLHITQAD
jgi:predicted glycogen debranching enzyme